MGLGTSPWPPPAPLPQSRPPTRADVLIVGAGVTGLSAAIALAQTGSAVAVIERKFGTGATSRSGGIVLGDTLVGAAPGFEHCEDALRTWVIESGMPCDLRWAGCLELARDEGLGSQPVDWNDEGCVRLASHVGGGVLHPTQLLAGLAQAALIGGATIADGIDVGAIDACAEGLAIETTAGRVVADHVVMAVDATARSREFDPWNQRAITVALQTVPMPDEVITDLGLMPDQAFYTRDLPLLWGRVMPDRSLLVGREVLVFDPGEGSDQGGLDVAGSRLTARVRGLHPALADVAVQRVWGGAIARTAAGVPAIVEDPAVPGVLWAGGYGGHGLAQAFRVGTMIAHRLAKGDPQT